MQMIKAFIKWESSAGLALMLAALVALGINNFGAHTHYQMWLAHRFGPMGLFLNFSVLEWVNNGLMAIFFLLVGLEIKRELCVGELNSWSKSMMPLMAAVGGMLVPALLFYVLNHHDPIKLRGWPIPTATDIAFSLGVLSLLGKRVPLSLKVFLTALAIFDDIGAILIITFFYGHHLVGLMLSVAAGIMVLLFILNRCRVTSLWPYLLLGVLLWYVVLQSGIHATIAGIVLALFVPVGGRHGVSQSPLSRLEHLLHPWVAFVILPIFAFSNAGVYLLNLQPRDLLHSVGLGIILGLIVGKSVGVMLGCYMGEKLGLRLPGMMNYKHLLGLSFLAGIGFTMSLFVGGLAYLMLAPEYMVQVKLGVLLGSLLAAFLGVAVLLVNSKKPNHTRHPVA